MRVQRYSNIHLRKCDTYLEVQRYVGLENNARCHFISFQFKCACARTSDSCRLLIFNLFLAGVQEVIQTSHSCISPSNCFSLLLMLLLQFNLIAMYKKILRPNSLYDNTPTFTFLISFQGWLCACHSLIIANGLLAFNADY